MVHWRSETWVSGHYRNGSWVEGHHRSGTWAGDPVRGAKYHSWFQEIGSPFTYPTSCWWCGEPVFFHRAEAGGCVLFDSLGPPWPVHFCWELHNRRAKILDQTFGELENLGFNGYCLPVQGRFLRPRDGLAIKASVVGIVAENDCWDAGVQDLYMSLVRGGPSIPLGQIQLGTREGRYRVFLPRELAEDLDENEILELDSVWQRLGKRWGLVVRRLRRLSPGERTQRFRRVLRIEGRCHGCGRRLKTSEEWALDDQGNQECQICCRARGLRTRGDFLRWLKRAGRYQTGT